MDSGFYWYAFKRVSLFSGLIIGFCLLPGPRSLIGEYLAYLWLPKSTESVSYGIHLSLIHFCWLFGYELPSLTYPEFVEPQLTSAAIVISIICQLGVLAGFIVLWRLGLHAYYLRQATLDEIAEFGLDAAPDEDESAVVPPMEQVSVKKESLNQGQTHAKNGRRVERRARVDLAQVDGVDINQGERIAK